VQGELEHRNAKARYKRTSKKLFTKQMTQIERRQKRIRDIRQKILKESGTLSGIHSEVQSNNLDVHHHIGVSENLPEDIGLFLRVRAGDPAVQVQVDVISWTLYADIALS
jgi:hypothetical protein